MMYEYFRNGCLILVQLSLLTCICTASGFDFQGGIMCESLHINMKALATIYGHPDSLHHESSTTTSTYILDNVGMRDEIKMNVNGIGSLIPNHYQDLSTSSSISGLRVPTFQPSPESTTCSTQSSPSSIPLSASSENIESSHLPTSRPPSVIPACLPSFEPIHDTGYAVTLVHKISVPRCTIQTIQAHSFEHKDVLDLVGFGFNIFRGHTDDERFLRKEPLDRKKIQEEVSSLFSEDPGLKCLVLLLLIVDIVLLVRLMLRIRCILFFMSYLGDLVVSTILWLFRDSNDNVRRDCELRVVHSATRSDLEVYQYGQLERVSLHEGSDIPVFSEHSGDAVSYQAPQAVQEEIKQDGNDDNARNEICKMTFENRTALVTLTAAEDRSTVSTCSDIDRAYVKML